MLDLAHLKKVSTDTYVYKQLFMEIRDRYCDYIPVYADSSWDGDSVACATVFSSDIVIFMRLSDSACIFAAETWPNIKDSDTSKYIILWAHFCVFTPYSI